MRLYFKRYDTLKLKLFPNLSIALKSFLDRSFKRSSKYFSGMQYLLILELMFKEIPKPYNPSLREALQESLRKE